MGFHNISYQQDIVYYHDELFAWKTEQWKDVLNYEGLYQISNIGRIKSFINKKDGCFSILKQKDNKGYLKFNACKNGKIKTLSIHRLVAQHFIPNPDNKPDVNHKKGNKKDNRYWKIEWNTKLENNVHAYSIGLKKGRKGIYCNLSKLTNDQISEIKCNPKNLNQRELGEVYNVSQSNISYILSNKTWKK